MNRQKETVDADNFEQQFQEKRQTRIDAVRRQGEKRLRKVIIISSILIDIEIIVFIFKKNRCVNKY
jgi:hypothetical protein